VSPVVLRAAGLTVGYRSRRRTSPVLKNVDVELHRGELVSLLGANGTGKSTLLRTLCGMQRPLAGNVQTDHHDVHRMPIIELARHLAVVLTDRVDVGLMTAHSIVALGRYPHTGWGGTLDETDRAAVESALTATGATPLADRPMVELSDGERQRVLIARALAQEPSALVLDEPTAFLDAPRRVAVMAMLRELTRTNGLAVLVSTHDVDLALRISDAVWLLADGAMAIGGPEDLTAGGALTRAFTTDAVRFDAATATFELTPERRATTYIDAHPEQVPLLARLAAREGFAVVEAAEHANVVIGYDPLTGRPWAASPGGHDRRAHLDHATLAADLRARSGTTSLQRPASEQPATAAQ
jgi:iron complex transport system ATP-binding protein